MLSEPVEQQGGKEEPHGEATRDSHPSGCGQESQLRASRMMRASRRPLLVDTETSTPALDAGVETGETTLVAEASMRWTRLDTTSLSSQRSAESVSRPPLPRSLLRSPRTVARSQIGPLSPAVEKELPTQSLSRHRQDRRHINLSQSQIHGSAANVE